MDAAELVEIHYAVAGLFAERGDPLTFTGEREMGAADAVIGRVYSTFDGKDLFRSGRERAAVLCHGVNASHVFRDGNKRTSLAAMVNFLDQADFRLECSDEDLYSFVVNVAAHYAPFDDEDSAEVVAAMTQWLTANTIKKTKSLPRMKFDLFKQRFVALGGRISVNKNNGTVLRGPMPDVGSSKSVTTLVTSAQIDGQVAENWLRSTGIIGAGSDYGPHDFLHGRMMQPLINDLIDVMQRLADYDRRD